MAMHVRSKLAFCRCLFLRVNTYKVKENTAVPAYESQRVVNLCFVFWFFIYWVDARFTSFKNSYNAEVS